MRGADVESEFERRKPWVTKFIIDGNEYGGDYDPRADPRLPWFFQHFPETETILELGSLEGGHTFKLAENWSVKSVLGIEGRQENLEKAAFVQRLLGADKVKFILADLESVDLRPLGPFDVVFCVGVLYHLRRPWRLIEQISNVSKNLFVWTHYAPVDPMNVVVNGFEGKWYRELGQADPLSGLSPESFWLARDSLMDMMRSEGFKIIHVIEDNLSIPHGPAITLAVMSD